MAAKGVAILAVMLVTLAALAATASGAEAPAPSPSGGPMGATPSLQMVFVGLVVAAVSFSTLKELV